MELNINSPAYFTNHYGVDDEVYRYCQNLHNYFKTKEYSETLTIIGITPIVAPKVLAVTNGRQVLRLVLMEKNARYAPVRE